MRKLLLFSIIFLMIGSNIFADNNNKKLITKETNTVQESNNQVNYYKVSTMLSKINNVEDSQIQEIKQLTINFSNVEKNTLYYANQKKIGRPFLVNAILGKGIGSFMQGDIKGGLISLSGELLSFTIISIGYGISVATDEEYGDSTMLIGLISFVSCKIFELIRPFYFASNYNTKLSQALNYVAVTQSISTNEQFSLNISYTIPL